MIPKVSRRITFQVVLMMLFAGAISVGHEQCVGAEDNEKVREALKLFRTEFVQITPGKGQFAAEFQFGEASIPGQPQQKITLTQPLEVSKFETYQSLYEVVMGTNPSRWKGPRNSVERVSLRDAEQFCQKVTALLRQDKLIRDDQVVRLPTEVEWEYFARAGTDTQYSFGKDAQAEGDVDPKATILDAYAWHTGNAAGNDPAVGTLKPNPWGLYDIHGYLWELCSDDWSVSITTSDDPHLPYRHREGAASAVIRGGSWKDNYSLLSSASRRAVAKADGLDDAIGFRCVIATVPSPASK